MGYQRNSWQVLLLPDRTQPLRLRRLFRGRQKRRLGPQKEGSSEGKESPAGAAMASGNDKRKADRPWRGGVVDGLSRQMKQAVFGSELTE